MPRYTVAYSEFVRRSDEVLLLAKRARKIERSKDAYEHGDEIKALCRGAMVLLSSHIEAYVKELAESALDAIYSKEICRSKIDKKFFYYTSKGWINRIKDSNIPSTISEEVFRFLTDESELWNRTGPLPRSIDSQEFCMGFSNPKFDKIRKFLGRFGYEGLRHHLNLTHQADAILMIANLEQIVDTRNAIAHGESSATRTPREVSIHIASAKVFCRSVDDGFATWCKANLCSIR